MSKSPIINFHTSHMKSPPHPDLISIIHIHQCVIFPVNFKIDKLKAQTFETNWIKNQISINFPSGTISLAGYFVKRTIESFTFWESLLDMLLQKSN